MERGCMSKRSFDARTPSGVTNGLEHLAIIREISDTKRDKGKKKQTREEGKKRSPLVLFISYTFYL